MCNSVIFTIVCVPGGLHSGYVYHLLWLVVLNIPADAAL